jgi:hypothetical protein
MPNRKHLGSLPAAIAIAVALVSPTRSSAEPETWTLPAEGIDLLDIDLAAAGLRLVGLPAAADEIRVRVEMISGDGSCDVRVGDVGDVLDVRVRPAKANLRGYCEASVEIEVPASIEVDADVGPGTITLEHLGSMADLSVGPGHVRGTAHSPRLRVHTGPGDVDLAGLVGRVDVDSGPGDVSLRFIRAPEDVVVEAGLGDVSVWFETAPRGHVDIVGGLGDVAVWLPAGAAVDLEVSHVLGEKVIEFEDDAEAAGLLEIKAGLGDLFVRSWKP